MTRGVSLPLFAEPARGLAGPRRVADSAHLMIGGGTGSSRARWTCRAATRRWCCWSRENAALRLAPLPDGTQRLLPRWEPQLELMTCRAARSAPAMRRGGNTGWRQPFALHDGTPPWRFALLRAHDRLHGLAMQFHHV
jgi:hypothetical protein